MIFATCVWQAQKRELRSTFAEIYSYLKKMLTVIYREKVKVYISRFLVLFVYKFIYITLRSVEVSELPFFPL